MTIIETRNFILNEIGSSLYSQVKRASSVNKSFDVQSILSVDCNTTDKNGDNLCLNCTKHFDITDAMMEGEEFLKNIDKIKKVWKNQCAGACLCKVEDVTMENTVFFDTSFELKTGDLNPDETMAHVKTNIEKIYDTTMSTVQDKTLNDLIINISKNYKSTVSQLMTSYQLVLVKGPVQVKGVNMKMSTNAVFTAYHGSCDDDKCSVDILNDFITDLYRNMKNEIDQKFMDGFMNAVDKNIDLLIGCLVIFVLFCLSWIWLVIKKSWQTSNS